MAHNDCSIRQPNAIKISEKKNWGHATKGTSTQRIQVDGLNPGGVLDTYRLASFLHREQTYHPYGVDSPVIDYSYFHDTLVRWVIDRMNFQTDTGPLENIHQWIHKANCPPHALISIGATRYTPFGETHFLKPGDRAIVVLYDGARYSSESALSFVGQKHTQDIPGISILDQTVVYP